MYFTTVSLDYYVISFREPVPYRHFALGNRLQDQFHRLENISLSSCFIFWQGRLAYIISILYHFL